MRGFRIEPGEIESELSRCPGIGECAVVAHGESGSKWLAAFAVLTGEEAPDVRAWLRSRLPEPMVPSQVVFLDALPKTASGKLDRRALAQIPVQPEEAGGFAAPRTPVEEIVAGLWADILGREKIGVSESFFDLGGHSLLASRVLSRLRSALGVDLPLRDFFLQPTVEALARAAEQARRTGGGLELPPIPRRPHDQPLPLSFAQERLWLVDQLQPGNVAYNSFLALRLSGRLVVPVLEATLAEIVRRHEALRTRFVSDADGPKQVIDPLPILPWRFARIDLSALPAEVREIELARLVPEEAYRPFDLARGPLFRATVVLLDDRDHALLLNFHHIVCDGWSMGEVLTGEINALYNAFLAGRPSPLPELPIQYADFAAWQREWLQGETLESQLAWWKARLGDELPVLDLPTDRPRPGMLGSRGALESIVLPPAMLADLTALGQRYGATLFMTLLTGLQAMLHEYTGQDRINIGTAAGNRRRPEVENLFGLFLNTLVLGGDLSGDPTMGELLARIRDTTLDAFDHQDFPFEKLVAAYPGSRDPGRNPLFQVLFLLQNMRIAPLELPDLAVGDIFYETQRAQFELLLRGRRDPGGAPARGLLQHRAVRPADHHPHAGPPAARAGTHDRGAGAAALGACPALRRRAPAARAGVAEGGDRRGRGAGGEARPPPAAGERPHVQALAAAAGGARALVREGRPQVMCYPP